MRTSAKVIAASSLAGLGIERFAHAAGSGTIKVGLIGCGARGTGAAFDALGAGADVRLVAMADVFDDRMSSSLDNLRKGARGSQVQVAQDRKFLGFDAYKNVLASGVDAVILGTPPGFHPLHFEAAVRAGAHAFMEKPVAVDAPGVRQVRAAAVEARQKGLSAIVGLQDRYDTQCREFMAQIANGALGRITRQEAAIRQQKRFGNFKRSAEEKRLGRTLGEMEFQLRNWIRFTWLSGDCFVEALVHQLDNCVWALGKIPERAQGKAERKENTGSDFGNNCDVVSVTYKYADGIELVAETRFQADVVPVWKTTFDGDKAVASPSGQITDRNGQVIWNYAGPKPAPYSTEMNDWCASIRQSRGLNMMDSAADATLLSVMGRTAAYTGREVTWAEIQQSTEKFFLNNPKSFEDAPPDLPDKYGDYAFPPPGHRA